MLQDYSACKWPDWMPGSTQLGAEPTAAWFDAANESQLQQPGWDMLQQVLAAGSRSNGGGGDGGSSCSSSSGHTDIISFSHFLPHQHLLPEKRMLTYPNLVRGSSQVGTAHACLWGSYHMLAFCCRAEGQTDGQQRPEPSLC